MSTYQLAVTVEDGDMWHCIMCEQDVDTAFLMLAGLGMDVPTTIEPVCDECASKYTLAVCGGRVNQDELLPMQQPSDS